MHVHRYLHLAKCQISLRSSLGGHHLPRFGLCTLRRSTFRVLNAARRGLWESNGEWLTFRTCDGSNGHVVDGVESFRWRRRRRDAKVWRSFPWRSQIRVIQNPPANFSPGRISRAAVDSNATAVMQIATDRPMPLVIDIRPSASRDDANPSGTVTRRYDRRQAHRLAASWLIK